MKRLLLAGGGHAHVLVLRALADFVSKNLDVKLVTPSPLHTYSGMVPGVVAGHYAAPEAQIDLARLGAKAGVELVPGSVLSLDPVKKIAVLENGEEIPYDLLSLNLGSLPGLMERAIPVKPFAPFLRSWNALLERPGAPRIAIAGAGAGGVELAMAMKYALDRRRTGGSVELFSDRLAFPPGVAARIRNALDARSIRLHLDPRIGFEFDAVFQVTGATALPLLRDSGLKTDAQGFVVVGPDLRSVSHADVFAAGDNASLAGSALSKSGVYAVRQGAVLAENLKLALLGKELRPYVPQKESLSLISCGGKYAVASRGRWSAEGAWVWWWKNWLDRRWISRFS